MATATDLEAGLAYDVEGTGTPVVFLHGLTFDRRTWRPIIDQLDGAVTSIAIDLPAHGDSGGEPAPLESVAERIHRLLHSLGIERPVVVGHSMSAAVAGLYASAHPARGIVLVDQATEVMPFAQMLHQVAPMLRGPSFGQVWPNIEDSLGLDRIPEPARRLVLETHKVAQDVVLGYWDQVLTTEPAELQAWIDETAARIKIPCLAVFGRPATDGERERLGRLPDAQIEEWAGDGHFVHLVDPRRFAARLRTFIEHCDQAGPGPDVSRAGSAPRLAGVHHLKVHVADVRRSALWYQRVLGYQPVVEFAEAGRLVGYGLGHPRGGTFLTLRLDPEHAARTAGRVYFEMGAPDKAALDELARRLDDLGEPDGPVLRTPVGWVLPDLYDPDGHEMRFYLTDESAPTAARPARMHDAGPQARIEQLDSLDLAPNA